MELLRLFLFLLDFLRFRLKVLQIRHIQELNPRHVHQTADIYGTVIHGIKTSLHAVRTYRDVVRQFDHLSRHTLRAMTDEADLLISVILLILFPVF